jgi:uncharacterized repeat protein (TIGR01451 family)
MASALAAAALLWSAAGIAGAAGTAAKTVVSNTATVNFTVGTVAQPAVTSTAVDFMVDRRVDLTVTTLIASEVLVTPASTGNGILFTLTNTSNATLNFALNAANFATNPFAPPADSFDLTVLTAVVSADAVCDVTDLAGATTAVDLAAEASVFVCVLAAIPGGQASGSVAAVRLLATARENSIDGGGALSQEAGLDVAATMQTVFADGAGVDDALRDAAFSEDGAYLVQSADVTITKTETLISDPINGVSNPRHIPGAVIEYQVTVTNPVTSAVAASSLTISDLLPAGITFAPNTYAGASGIRVGATAMTNATGDDAAEFAGGAVTVTVPTLAVNTSVVITFRATVTFP